MANCSPFAPSSETGDKDNLACAFSVNVVLTAPRAENGGVCLGVSVAVYFMVYLFGSVCRGTVTLAATVMLMKDTFGWTFQSGCFDHMAFDTV